jgi:uncharacterized protein
MPNDIHKFEEPAANGPAVHGYLHTPVRPSGEGLVLTHGAGSNCEAPLLIAVANAFSDAGFAVLRCDLPFRQLSPSGPPKWPGIAAQDRAGLRRAIAELRKIAPERVFLAGHSYGGRQSSMLAAEELDVADGLLLLSYPLHPPKQLAKLCTTHFPALRTPSLFIHGSRDGFGAIDELTAALRLIPAQTQLVPIQSAGHELLNAKNRTTLPQTIVEAFVSFFQRE